MLFSQSKCFVCGPVFHDTLNRTAADFKLKVNKKNYTFYCLKLRSKNMYGDDESHRKTTKFGMKASFLTPKTMKKLSDKIRSSKTSLWLSFYRELLSYIYSVL
jgi:hypothetical protein